MFQVLGSNQSATLAHGNTCFISSHYQVIVIQLKEGQEAGNLADPRYKKVEANYEQKKEGEPYITAEFSSKDAKENTFTVGDKKYYSRSGVTESRRKRRKTGMSYL